MEYFSKCPLSIATGKALAIDLSENSRHERNLCVEVFGVLLTVLSPGPNRSDGRAVSLHRSLRHLRPGAPDHDDRDGEQSDEDEA